MSNPKGRVMLRSLAVVGAMFLVVTAPRADNGSGGDVHPDGIPHSRILQSSTQPTRVFRTEDVWRHGGEEDSVVFGQIVDIVVGPDKNTFVLDQQLNQVHVVSPDGDRMWAIGRDGEGPGEFRNPCGLGVFSDGTVCVFQSMPARAVLLLRDGTAAGDQALSPEGHWAPSFLNGGAVVLDQPVLYAAEVQQKKASLVLTTNFTRIDRDGNVVANYWKRTQSADAANIEFDEQSDAAPVWAVGPDGRLYVNVAWDRYEIEVRNADGSLAYRIEREYEPYERTAHDFAAVRRKIESGLMSEDTKISKTVPDIQALFPRDDGSLWVLSSRGEKGVAPGTLATLDVFDEAGRWNGQVTLLHPQYSPGIDTFYLVNDLVYIATNAGEWATEIDGGDMELLCTRMAKVR